jgi:transcriptional repressor NrdR
MSTPRRAQRDRVSLRCPFCSASEQKGSEIIETRYDEERAALRRRRRCKGPQQHVFVSYETYAGQVVKKDAALEDFSRAKLYEALDRAANKRDIEAAVLWGIVDEIHARAVSEGQIEAEAIGQHALDALRNIDEVAWARFASVLHKYDSLSDFGDLIRHGARTRRVIKSDGRAEVFDRRKLIKGLRKGVRGLEGIPEDALDKFADEVDERIGHRKTVNSSELGHWAMEYLRSLHPVAYLRYANVHIGFKQLEDFEAEIAMLKKDEPVQVVKRDGRGEPFDRRKLTKGLRKATWGIDGVGEDTVSALADRVQQRLNGCTSVSSSEIGRWLMDDLRAEHPVAYLRYANVQVGFEHLEDFEAEIAALKGGKVEEGGS